MLDVLSANSVLLTFLVITLGALVGAIPIGPVKFGAAGALFVGLAFGAFTHVNPAVLSVFQDLGLGMFVYLIGLEAGETFFKEIKQQFALMLVAMVAVTLGAISAVTSGELIGLEREISVGAFAGSLTSTPSLALATEQAGNDLPSVGYSIGYPVGIAVAIVLIALTINREWKARNDLVNADDAILRNIRVRVKHATSGMELEEIFGSFIRIATIRRQSHTLIARPNQDLQEGDVVSLFVTKSAENEIIKFMGTRVPRNPFADPRISMRRVQLSNRDLAGRQVADIPLFKNFQSRITKIRRGDSEFLVNPDTYLELGDTVELVVMSRNAAAVSAYFGDSIQTSSELDTVATFGGLALGFAVGLITVPLPGGASFKLGAAAGPIIVGMILGAIHRTGAIPWQIPRSANYTLRQLGLLVFLASVGLASGDAFASTAFSMTGLKTIIVCVIVGLFGCGSFIIISWLMGRSPARANGGVAGVLGQPAVLSYATSKTSDPRIMSGYATTFAIALIYKIVIVPFMFV